MIPANSGSRRQQLSHPRHQPGQLVRPAALLLSAMLVMGLDGAARAEVRLPSLIGDGMVLQRGTPLVIWGMASPNERVRIVFRGKTVIAVAGVNGRWRARLPSQSSGGPFTMEIIGQNRVLLSDVLVGDVWLASGQSNMAWPLSKTDHAVEDVAGPHSNQVRLFQIPRTAALTPQADVNGATWRAATSETTKDFSAVAYLFGQRLHARYKVPIGLIQSTWGGSYAESWINAKAMATISSYAQDLTKLKALGPDEVVAFDHYRQAYAAFSHAHRSDDFGTVNGRAIWAARDFDTSGWASIELPSPEPGRPDSSWGVYNRFDGNVWFRRTANVPIEVDGRAITLRLGVPYAKQRAFWNGVELEQVLEGDNAVYQVPAKLVSAGKATVSFRLSGSDGFIGVFGHPHALQIESGDWRVSLVGGWLYRIGTDVAALPIPPTSAQFLVKPGIVVLWNGMIAPITSYAIKGVVWYQGESNVSAADTYRQLFPTLISSWRSAWQQQFPFLFVQIAGYDGYNADAAELREAQGEALHMPTTGMATAADLGDSRDIHPTNKRDVAARLELVARRVAYGEAVVAFGPTLRTVKRERGSLRLTFDNLGGGLINRAAGVLRGFTVADDDAELFPADAVIDGNEVVVKSAKVALPTSVRYVWANAPNGTLGSCDGLPALPFRFPQPDYAR